MKEPLPELTSPFLKLLDVRLLHRDVGVAEMGVTITDKHLRSRGIMHGGVGASLLDSAMGVAVSTKTPAGHITVTAQLSVNYIRPAWLGEELRITADLSHCGKQTAVARGELRTLDGVLVALSTGTFLFVRDLAPNQENLLRHCDRSQVDADK